ncbi:MAG: hydantoin racemase [Coprococcus sp.]|nr:hydantoin racemase [Coprococcus sp.]
MDKRWKVGLIRVVTLNDERLARMHGEIIMEKFPCLEVETKCIPDQYEGIHSPETKKQAVPKIIELAKSFQDIDVLIVSCADDPAVLELRKQLEIPVVGAGGSVATLASRYGQRAGILGITDYAPPPYEQILGKGLINLGRPEGVNSTLDLMTSEGKESVVHLAMKLKEAGADSIALSCTGMSTIRIAGLLSDRTGLPVIDPVTAEGLMAYYEFVKI